MSAYRSRVAELARVRAARGLSEEDCQIWLGVSLATLERVEAGEIEPAPELEARIARFLSVVGNLHQHCGGSFPLASAPPELTAGTRASSLGGGGDETVLARAPAASLRGAPFDGAPIQSNRGAGFDGAPIQSNRGAL